ncbi:MAG: glutamate--tRNA ligase, partial [Endomicrobiales bacterium]
MSIRVRFAPSPTGFLHIGGARTALFNWLFARHNKATFILRIEDTDEARSTEESVGAIIESMKWLGLEWDEGPGRENPKYAPYFQMQRKEAGIYRKYVDQLLAQGKAYYCYCTPEELDEMRKKALAEKKPLKYDRKCCHLTPEERADREAQGRRAVIRFKRPADAPVKLHDLIAGDVEFDSNLLDDIVIMKASGVPTYNFACVVDDYLMDITHVIRGNDHLSNTPRQVQLYEALGWKDRIPVFAHLSMILGPDGARLSKRHGHTSVLEYRTDGYLPDALVNYLALLGWSTEDSQQLFEKQELTEKFTVERCSNSPAIFDPQKLLWMNGEYIRKQDPAELTRIFLSWMQETGQLDRIQGWDRARIGQVITLERDKIKLLKDIPGLIDFFFTDNVEYREDAVNKVLKTPTAKAVLEESLARLEQQSDFSADALEKLARDFAA